MKCKNHRFQSNFLQEEACNQWISRSESMSIFKGTEISGRERHINPAYRQRKGGVWEFVECGEIWGTRLLSFGTSNWSLFFCIFWKRTLCINKYQKRSQNLILRRVMTGEEGLLAYHWPCFFVFLQWTSVVQDKQARRAILGCLCEMTRRYN